MITGYTYQRYTRLIDEQTTQVAENVFTKATEELEASIEQANHIYRILSTYSYTMQDSMINDIQKYAGPQTNYNDYDVFASNRRIQFIGQMMLFASENLNGISIFTPYGPVISYSYANSMDVRYQYKPDGDEWYKNTLALQGGTYVDGITSKEYFINTRPSVTFTKAIYDVYSKKFLGILMVDCKPDIFDLSTVNTLPETITLTVLNEKTGCVLYTNAADIKSDAKSDLRFMKADLSIEGLSLTAAVNYSLLNRKFGQTRAMIVGLAVACVITVILLSIILSRSITRPISYLSSRMASREGNNAITDSSFLRRTDEVGVLYNEYNSLLEELDRSVKSEYQNKLIAMDSQMKSLEAQINSHFLYNTLESINSIAAIEGVDTIATMSLALGNMFRYSIKTKSELVTIQDELKHVQDYISIQQIRFDNRFSLAVEIPDEMQELLVLKLILQPLVENALLHGLAERQMNGQITIRGRTNGKHILLEVKDNGIGIEERTLKEIHAALQQEPKFTELGQRNTQRIGLKNIHSRIELYYGRGYGLSVESQKGVGTCISIKCVLQNFS
jgi:two-component system sensor histidine kinase YesM